MKKNRLLAALLVFVMLLCLFSGCSSSGKEEETKQEPEQAADAKTSEEEPADDAAKTEPEADGKVYKLKIAYNPPELTPDTCTETCVAYSLRDYLNEKAPGRFEIEIYPSAQLGTFDEMLAGASDGSIEMSIVNIGTLASVDQSLNVWQIPGSIASIEECNALLASEEGKATFANIESNMGIMMVAGFTSGPRHFTNNVRELKTPEDMKGIVFRVMQNNLYVKMVESMGAIATPMSSSELYSALQNKVVEGQENPIASIINDITYEVQKYLTLDGHVYSIPICVVNTAWFNTLSEDLQQIFLDGIEVAREDVIKFIDKQESEGLEFLKEKGMTVYEPTEEELEQWHEAVYNGVIDYVYEQVGEEQVNDFLAMIESYRQSA